MEIWIQALTNLGLGGGVLLAIGFAAWKITVWAGRELVIPFRDRMLIRVDQFFTRLEKNLDQVDATLIIVAKSLSDHAKVCRDHADKLEEIKERLFSEDKK